MLKYEHNSSSFEYRVFTREHVSSCSENGVITREHVGSCSEYEVITCEHIDSCLDYMLVLVQNTKWLLVKTLNILFWVMGFADMSVDEEGLSNFCTPFTPPFRFLTSGPAKRVWLLLITERLYKRGLRNYKVNNLPKSCHYSTPCLNYPRNFCISLSNKTANAIYGKCTLYKYT